MLCATVAFADSLPIVTSYPAVSSRIKADDTTSYRVGTTVSDGDGYNDIKCIRIMFGYCAAEGDPTKSRGYLAWGQTDADILKYGGTWVISDASDGTRWGYQTSSPWGETAYLTPVSCTTTKLGASIGDAGSRTVYIYFKAKPAWALNPIINNPNYYISDSTHNIGWFESVNDFDVLPSSITSYAQTPPAPLAANIASNTVDITPDPSCSSTDLFCIKVSPQVGGKSYVQGDGSFGYSPVWQTKAQWGTVTTNGLKALTSYSIKMKAFSNASNVGTSTWSPVRTITTLAQSNAINAGAGGKPISPYIRGLATRLDVCQYWPGAINKLWDVLDNNFARGIAGGLDLDTYNWKDMSGQGVGHQGTPGANIPTTLDWMRLVRDHNSTAIVGANMRGIGPLEASGYGRFYYTNTDIDMLKKLAADWVRYVNFILPNYRQGDTLSASDQAIVDSINWYGRQKLLAPGEATTPKVMYWEIGNEPELGLPWASSYPIFQPGPAEYSDRYKQIAQAMLAVDPTIKVGPCITTANSENSWLSALLNDHENVVDFISYHPYGALSGYAANYGDTADAAELCLKIVKQQQAEYKNGIVDRIVESGRNPDNIKLVASEHNVSNWKWEMSAYVARMSHALGIAETVFAFADMDVFGGHYWSIPTYGDGVETPFYKLYREFGTSLGNSLVYSFTDNDTLRIYATWNTSQRELNLWILNFSNAESKPISFAINNIGAVDRVLCKKLGKLDGVTGLLDYQADSGVTTIDWTTTDLTGSIDPASFSIVAPASEITLYKFRVSTSTIADIRSKADGESVIIDSAAVSAAFSECFYIESDDRTSGIKVNLANHNISEGQRVFVRGTIATEPTGERCINAVEAVAGGGVSVVEPLGMTNTALGGAAGGYQPGVWGWRVIKDSDTGLHERRWLPSVGLNNIGLYVSVWGAIKSLDSDSFVIDDGSGQDVKCVFESDVQVNPDWKYVKVTGISSCEKRNDDIVRLIRVQSVEG